MEIITQKRYFLSLESADKTLLSSNNYKNPLNKPGSINPFSLNQIGKHQSFCK